MGVSDERRAIDRARTARAAAADVQGLLDQSSADDELKAVLVGSDGERTLTLPRVALGLLVEVLEALGDGREPSVVPMAKELSTGEVAGLLGVSRQYAVRLLDDGRLPYRRVGNRRRVQLRDVLAYLRDDNRRRVNGLRDVAEASFS